MRSVGGTSGRRGDPLAAYEAARGWEGSSMLRMEI